DAESFDIRSRDATCGSLARVALFRGFPGLLWRPASLRRLPSDAVGLARFGHAPPRSDLPGLVTRHGHLSWRVCPRLPAEVLTCPEGRTRVEDPCPIRHHGAGRR